MEIRVKKYAGPERRKYQRLVKTIPVFYHAGRDVSLDYLSEPRDCMTRNIGAEGLCLETETYVPVNTVIEVWSKKMVGKMRHAGLSIEAIGKVIWIKQIKIGRYRLGLEFVNISERHRDEIATNTKQKLNEGDEKEG